MNSRTGLAPSIRCLLVQPRRRRTDLQDRRCARQYGVHRRAAEGSSEGDAVDSRCHLNTIDLSPAAAAATERAVAGDDARSRRLLLARWPSISPANDEAIRDNTGNVLITAAVDAALCVRGHRCCSCSTRKPPKSKRSSRRSTSRTWTAARTPLRCRVVDRAGNVLKKSQPSTFHLQRVALPAAGSPRHRLSGRSCVRLERPAVWSHYFGAPVPVATIRVGQRGHRAWFRRHVSGSYAGCPPLALVRYLQTSVTRTTVAVTIAAPCPRLFTVACVRPTTSSTINPRRGGVG